MVARSSLALVTKRVALWTCVWMTVLAIALSLSGTSAFADDGGASPAIPSGADTALQAGAQSQVAPQAKRTILFYVCGSNLEEDSGLASNNLHQILSANFGNGEDVKFIVMTGGSRKWHMESDSLCFPDDIDVPDDAVLVGDLDYPDELQPEDPKSQISGPYNQIWEAKSTGATDNPGKLVLLDGDGFSNDKASVTKEWMSDPETLKAFINSNLGRPLCR